MKDVLDRLRGTRVLVVGDLMVDGYLWGDVSRVSPEAPVPVVRVAREEQRLGGAANVVHNLAALGCQVVATSLDPAALVFPESPVMFHVEQGVIRSAAGVVSRAENKSEKTP